MIDDKNSVTAARLRSTFWLVSTPCLYRRLFSDAAHEIVWEHFQTVQETSPLVLSRHQNNDVATALNRDPPGSLKPWWDTYVSGFRIPHVSRGEFYFQSKWINERLKRILNLKFLCENWPGIFNITRFCEIIFCLYFILTGFIEFSML